MTLLAPVLPPGLYSNGTVYQSKGRWYDASLVRFFSGTIRPVEGWLELTADNDTVTEITLDGVPRAILGWRGNDGSGSIGIGTNTKLYAHWLGHLYDITPAGFTAGTVDAAVGAGEYGEGLYSAGPYGTTDPTQVSVLPPAVWHLDTFGDYLVGCSSPNDGLLYYWDRNALNDAVLMDASAPEDCLGVVVTPERFVVALGANGAVRTVAWASQESLTDWTPTALNTAGDFVLEGKGSLIAGLRGKGETLLWTTAELFAMRYIGGTLVYGFEKVGGDCGLISAGGATIVDTQALWMGPNGFFRYDGFVKPIQCAVADRVFGDLNTVQQGKVTCYHIIEFGEVTWHYPSANSAENDRYVTYNYREDHWTTGELERTCGTDTGPIAFTVLGAANGKLYQHGIGWSHLDVDGTTELLPWLESGPFELGDGELLMFVEGIFPDDETYGNVAYTLYGAMDPTSTETTNGPYTLDTELNTRFTARQMRVRLDQVLGAEDWRANVPRFLAKSAGRRGSRRRITELPSSNPLVPAASVWRGTVADGSDIADGRTVAI